MIGNIIALLIIVALVILFGWLTFRAWKAKRWYIKWPGVIGSGLLTLVLVGVAGAGGRGLAMFYFPNVPPARDLQVAGTPEQLARGEYLVQIGCVGCHSAVGPEGLPSGQPPFSGGWNIAQAEGFDFIGAVIIENLTPGGKLAGYSDGDIFRAIRHGVNKDGHGLVFMPLLPFSEMSDGDIEAVIAYLRSQPAVTSSGPTGDHVNFVGVVMFGAGMFPAPAPRPASITAPPMGVTAAYGKYVATFGECRGCHGPELLGQTDPNTGQVIPNPRPLVGTLTLEQFAEMMQTGIRPGGAAFPETMPWQNASKMTAEDLNALYLYLTAPVQ